MLTTILAGLATTALLVVGLIVGLMLYDTYTVRRRPIDPKVATIICNAATRNPTPSPKDGDYKIIKQKVIEDRYMYGSEFFVDGEWFMVVLSSSLMGGTRYRTTQPTKYMTTDKTDYSSYYDQRLYETKVAAKYAACEEYHKVKARRLRERAAARCDNYNDQREVVTKGRCDCG